MSAPAVSVLMAAYNVEKYIGEAIDSILKQTFSDFEFIIIDDASTDGTRSLVKKYDDSRIVLIENSVNVKLAASLNKGLRAAKGKYIVRMDADDISHPERIAKLYQFAEANPDIQVTGTQMQVFGKEDGIRKFAMNDEEIKAGMIWSSPMPHATVIMRLKAIVENDLFYDETFPIGQDWKFWYDMKKYVKFSNLPEVLYFYRRGEQSITQRTSGQARERYEVMYRIILSELKISFTDNDLLLNIFIIGHFSIIPSAQSVHDARSWLEKLIIHNRQAKIYDQRAFESIAEKYWSQLFYKITPYGFSTIFSYFLVSGMSLKHFLYYIKYSFNRLIGRK